MQVPSLNAIVSMVGIIFFRRVVLEDEGALAAKVAQLSGLMEALGWPSSVGGGSGDGGGGRAGAGGGGRPLAACLEPPAKVMLAALHQAAECGGELRASFQVRRSGGAAFWDALQQAEEAGMLKAATAAAGSTGGRPKCYKVFPSFVDEQGGGGGGAKVKVEAGEGHGPRKEFFLLAAASMTGQRLTPDAEAAAGGAAPPSLLQQQLRPRMFVYNRSAGAFWYNTTLKCSPELQAAYRFCGWLIGQSLLNRAPLGVSLAPVLLQQLLHDVGSDGGSGGGGFRADLDTLAAFDPEAAASLRNLSSLPKDQLREMMKVEGLPTGTTVEQYVARAAKELLVDSVEWHAREVAAGFRLAVDPRVMRAWCLDAAALAAALGDGSGGGGEQDVDVRKAFRVVMDPELSGNGAVLGETESAILPPQDPRRLPGTYISYPHPCASPQLHRQMSGCEPVNDP